MKIYPCIIIGAGGAGCRAAISLYERGVTPLILSMKEKSVSKTFRAQGGIQAAIGPNDSSEMHYHDTMKAGDFANDPQVVKTLTDNAPDTIKWLVDVLKVDFDKDENGNLKLSKAGGLSHPRILSTAGSAGEKIAIPLWDYIDNLGLEIKENTAVISIKKENDTFEIEAINENEKIVFKASTVILASGGAMPEAMKVGKLGDQSIPDGLELATNLGAEIASPSLMQYHPTGVIKPSSLRRLRLPETMRGYGAILTNKNNDTFVDHLATRKVVTDAIVKEVKEGRGVETEDRYFGVWMHTENIDKENGEGYLKSNFPKIYKEFIDVEFDISKNPVLVYPIVHYSLGGVTINEFAETNVDGFFAAGEATWGVHGMDRLMGNSLLDIFVFGKIAGDSAYRYLQAIHNKNDE